VTYRDEIDLARYAEATPTEEMRVGCEELARLHTYAHTVVDGELIELKVDVLELGIRIHLCHGRDADPNSVWSARVDRWVHSDFQPDDHRVQLV
jgi:hypothetical protein